MLKNWDIKKRVLLLALLPTILISIVLGCYFTLIRFQDLEAQLHKEGHFIIRELTSASKYGLFTNNRHLLQDLTDATIDNPNIDAAIIFDDHKNILAYAGPYDEKLSLSAHELQPDNQVSVREDESNLIMIKPVMLNINTVENLKNNPLSTHTPTRVVGWVAIAFNPAGIRLAQYQTLFTSAIFLLLATLFSIIFAWRIGRDITDPLTAITEAVNKIKEGQLAIQLQPEFGGQLGMLSQGINQMTKALRRSQEELQQNIEQATHDLKESLETVEIQNIELNIARKEALEASRVKSEFIANISHEIRTPMNSIIGFTNLLLESELSPHQRDYLTTIKKSAANLLDIINDILDFSKIEAGKLRLHYIPMSLHECIDDVLELLAPNAHAKHIELISIIDKTIPSELIGDPLRLKQIIINLVGNAIKFTDKGSVEVHVGLKNSTTEHNEYLIEIIDTGLGLNEQEQKQLFRAFGQADSSVHRRYGGTGLGLAICKRLINQMGGTIGIKSETNLGSTFWFTFISEHAKTKLPGHIEYSRLNGSSILLFEEHPRVRFSLEFLLNTWGVTYVSSTNETEFNQALQEKRYQLVILGINQPSLGLKSLFSNLSQRNQPFIVLINSSNQEIIQEIKHQGALQCLIKPVSAKKLYHELCHGLLHKQKESLLPTHTPSPSAQRYEITALVVDDNEANLKLIKALLEKLSITVRTADDGERAVELAKQEHYDIIFMDIQMPKLDGIETTRVLRHAKHLNHATPIIAISAHILGTEKDTLIAAGMNDYLSKPLDESQLQTLLYKWVKKSKLNNVRSEHETPHSFISNAIIDLTLATKLAGGKPDLAIELLEMLIEKLPEEKATIIETYQTNDFEQLEHYVHKLHGATCYCGVPKLKQATHQFETVLKRQQHDRYAEYFQNLILAIEEVINEGEKIHHLPLFSN
ncbi:MAG: two-component sensor histidine kinase BarA [Legionellales bacterium]|nr:two-component sensor histidine kinase BarA [Legionellales bacterium]